MTCRIRKGWFGKAILQVDDEDGNWVDAYPQWHRGPFEILSKERLTLLLLAEQRAGLAEHKAHLAREARTIRKMKKL